jgi:multimeric flavodoxin WrbA
VHKKDDSTSTRVCELAEKIMGAQQADILTQTIRLSDFTFSNCIFCGRCMQHQACIYDPAFNTFYQNLCASDRFLLVVPFYSVIPSKVAMLLEKLNQFYYTTWLRDPQAKFALSGKKIAVIAHGGSNLKEQQHIAATYRDLLLKPLHYSFTSLGFDVLGAGDGDARRAVFGVEGFAHNKDSIFPDMRIDWEYVTQTIRPLVLDLIR